MRKYIVFLFLFFASVLSGTEKTLLTAFSSVSAKFPADACYVFFLLQTQGDDLTESLQKAEQKLSGFRIMLKKEFPRAKITVHTLNAGKDIKKSFLNDENKILYNISKLIMCTISPDEKKAAKLLDRGHESGLSPLHGKVNDRSGAVIYGISDPETVIKSLTEKALLCNRRQLSRLARIYGGTLGSMVHAEPAGPPKCFPVLFTFGQYSFELPSQFADIDPMIEVSHKLSCTYFLKKTEN